MFFARKSPCALLFLLLLTGSAVETVSSAAPPPSADSILVDSPPAPFLGVPSAPPETVVPAPTSTPSDTAIAAIRRHARELYGRGVLLEKQQAFSGAIVSYTNAARTDPTLRGPSFRIGRLYASRRQWDPAARAFREELRRNPDDRAAAREYALMLVELGDTTRPVRMLKDLTRRAPSDPTSWRALGFTQARLQQYADAEKSLRGAVALDAKYALAWRDLGVVLVAVERPREAREAYRRAIAADPQEGGAVLNLANLESEQGEHARALQLYRTAERLDTLQGYAYRGQVRELVALGREAEAGDVWRRWLTRTPFDTDVRESAARHYLRQRRPDVAVALARDGIRIAPGASDAWWLLGEMEAQNGDTLAAMSAFFTAQRRRPEGHPRAESSLTTLRSQASAELRARFVADSTAQAIADTTRTRRR
jgi:tetratricopeptide (TPR) repeat protein